MPRAKTPHAGTVSSIAKAMTKFAKVSGRKHLPWRIDQSAYSVLVSEFMLQQTQVDRVIPFFEAWMRRFPDFVTLAAADLDEVLAAWEGLGYYRRARSLHALAREVVAQGLHLDRDALRLEHRELVKLPGVGPYTAGAVLGYAFDVAAPAVDTNVRRVAMRVMGEWGRVGNPPTGASQDAVEAWMTSLMHTMGPRVALAAVMDLGAIVCTARNPSCGQCPLAAMCRGRSLEVTTESEPKFASRKRASSAQKPRQAVGLLRDDRVLLLARRGAFPIERLGGEEFTSDPRHAIKKWYLDHFQLPVAVRPEHSRATIRGVSTSLHRCAVLKSEYAPFEPATPASLAKQCPEMRICAAALRLTFADGNPITATSEPPSRPKPPR